MTEFGGGIDPFKVDLFEGEAFFVIDQRFAKSKWALLWTNTATTDHDEVLIDETIMRESTLKINIGK